MAGKGWLLHLVVLAQQSKELEYEAEYRERQEGLQAESEELPINVRIMPKL